MDLLRDLKVPLSGRHGARHTRWPALFDTWVDRRSTEVIPPDRRSP
jgi:hypothetical protein